MPKFQASIANFLNLSIFIGCIVGFVFITKEHWTLFREKKTAYGTEWESLKGHRLPFVVFCPKNGGAGKLIVNKTRYDELSKLDLDISAVNIRYHQFDVERSIKNETFDIYTLYNGKCKAFFFPEEQPMRSTVKFFGKAGQDMSVYFLRDKTEALFLSFLFFDNLPAVTSFQESQSVEIQLRRTISLSLDGAFRCAETGNKTTDMSVFGDCAIRKVVERINENFDSPCVPAQIQTYAQEENWNPDCDNVTKMTEALSLASDVLTEQITSVDSGESCPYSCTFYEYDYVTLPLSLGKDYDDSMILLLRYMSTYVRTHRQYFIVNGVDLFSAIGGTLGLFLGWSIYQNAYIIINVVSEMLQQKHQKKKKKTLSPVKRNLKEKTSARAMEYE